MSDRAAPYPGLRPFEEKDRAIFFGREAQTVSVLSLLEENQFVAVVGSSGSGKSSLILASAIPAIREGFLRATRNWKIVVLKPGSDPCGNLARALEREGLGQQRRRQTLVAAGDGIEERMSWRREDALSAPALAADEGEQAESLVEKLHTADGALLDLLPPASIPATPQFGSNESREFATSAATLKFAPPEEADEARVLIVVDQFEELFTFRRVEAETGTKGARFAPRDEAATFVRLLLRGCAEPGGRIAVIITMRSDFIGDCDAFLELPELVSKCQFLVPRLDRSQMRDAIERPGEVEGLGYAPFAFEEGLVSRIIAEAGDRLDQLPLMQHALMRTWKEAGGPDAPPGSSLTLRDEHYEKSGEIAGALSKHADLAWATIKGDEIKERITRQLFLLLSDVHPDGKIVRRRPLLAEVQAITGADIPAIEKIVRLFQSDDRNFLLPPLRAGDHLSDNDRLDISHEALLRQWTVFGKWLDQERNWKIWLQDLSQAAKDYDEDPKTEPWHGNDLRGAEEWLESAQPSEAWARRHGVSNWDECLAFLDLSRKEEAQSEEREREEARQIQAEKDRHQQNLRRIRWTGTVIVVLLLTLMYNMLRRTQESERRARDAIYLFGTTAADVALPITAYAASALSTAEQQVEKLTGALAKAGTEPPPDKAAIDELLNARKDAEAAAAAIENLAASLHKAALDMTEDSSYKHNADLLTAEAATVRRRLDALQRKPEALTIINTSLVQRIERLEQLLAGLLGSENPDPALVLAKDQDIVKATSEFYAIVAMNAAVEALGFTDADFAELSKRAEPVWPALDAAQRVKEATRRIKEAALGTVQAPVWSKDRALELKHVGKVNRVRFSPDARLIASAGEDKTVRLWDDKGNPLWTKTISSAINDIGFNPRGDAIAVASSGSTVRLLRWDSGTIVETAFERHSDTITDVEFSHGGERVVSGSADKTVRVFLSRTMEQFYFTSPPLPGIVTSVAFHRGDNLVVSACDDGAVRLHTIIDPRSVKVLGTFDAPARRPEFSSDGELIVAASGDRTARVWQTRDRNEVARIEHPASVTHATFRPGEPSLVTAATNGEIRFVRLVLLPGDSSFEEKILERRHPGAAVFAAWSGANLLATVGGSEVILWRWTGDDPAVILRIVDLNPAPSRAEFSPDGRLLVTYGGDQVALLWDLTKLPATP